MGVRFAVIVPLVGVAVDCGIVGKLSVVNDQTADPRWVPIPYQPSVSLLTSAFQ